MVMRFGGRFCTVVLLATLVAATAFATDYAGPPNGLEEIQVTATRISRAANEVAIAVSLLDDEDITALAPENLAEAMRGSVGAMYQQTTPGQGTPKLRGLKGSQVLHLVGSMRLNNSFFRSAPNQYLAARQPNLRFV